MKKGRTRRKPWCPALLRAGAMRLGYIRPVVLPHAGEQIARPVGGRHRRSQGTQPTKELPTPWGWSVMGRVLAARGPLLPVSAGGQKNYSRHRNAPLAR
jgi:hypothetical protein